MKRSILLSLLGLTLFVWNGSAQQPTPEETPRIVGEVTVTAKNANLDPIYRELRGRIGQRSFDCFAVNNLALKKDRAIFTFKSGEVCFMSPVKGRSVGAVFFGEGDISLTPPNEAEKKMLAIFTDTPELKESFSQLVMMFTDKTADEIKNAPGTSPGSANNVSRAADVYKEKEAIYKKLLRYNIQSRTLTDILSPERPGFFYALIEGRKYPKLIFKLDPLGIPEAYPEQLTLSSYADNNGGIWVASHLEDEYKKGKANSWADRRLYDILDHNLDTTIQGTRLIIKDVLTIRMRVGGVRFLAFDLFSTLRVKSVRGEDNAEMDYVQEGKDEDADFGVILPAAMAANKVFKLTVEYDGLDALAQAGSGNYVLLPPARSTWYPNNPFTAFGDRATFDMTFRFPKKFVLVGAGDQVGEDKVEGDQKISQWTSDGVDFAVSGFNYGDFKAQELKDPDTNYNLEVFTNKDLPAQMKEATMMSADEEFGASIGNISTTDGGKNVLTQAQNATRIYNKFFGPLPYKRVAMTQQPYAGFGQAWPTLVFMPYIAFLGSTQRTQFMGSRGGVNKFWTEVAAHEVAHQWWGHKVGWTSYHDQWMSEGFAEFSTSLYVFYVEGDIKKFTNYWENQRKRIVESSPATNGRKPYTVGPVTQGYRLNNGKSGDWIAQSLIYPKGAYILHMIRMMMYDFKGNTQDAQFQKMMTEFLDSHANRDVSTNDFKLAVEKYMTKDMNVDGNGKMDWFFDSWVYGSDVPEFKLTYQTGNVSGKQTFSAQITQSGVSKDFVSRVPLYMDFGKGWQFIGRATIVGNSTADINIPVAEAPKKASIDVYKDILNTAITTK